MKNKYFLINGLNNQSISEVSNEIYNLEKQAWKECMRASLDTISLRLNVFSVGLWRLYENNNLVSYMFFIRLNKSDVQNYYSWFDYCQNGSCTNHSDNGTILFGVSIGSNKEGMGTKIFNLGIEKILSGIYNDVSEICMCSRIPTLSKYYSNENEISIPLDDLILQNDPVVKMILSKGFQPLKLCREGFHVDNESLGYSLTMGRKIYEY